MKHRTASRRVVAILVSALALAATAIACAAPIASASAAAVDARGGILETLLNAAGIELPQDSEPSDDAGTLPSGTASILPGDSGQAADPGAIGPDAADPGDGSDCATYEQLAERFLAYYDQGVREFEIQCSQALFDDISANDFKVLHQLEAFGHIDERDMTYWNSGRLSYGNVVYRDAPVYGCASVEDAAAGVAQCVASGSASATFVCADELYDLLFSQSHLRHLAAKEGIADLELYGYSASKVIYVDNMVAFDVPYLVAQDGTEYLEALGEFHERGLSDFVVVANPVLYSSLMEDEERMLDELHALGCLGAYSWRSSDGSCAVRYTETSFVDAPRVPCETVEDIVSVIRQMGSAGITDFDLVLGRELYAQMSADDFSAFDETCTEAGLVSYNYRHYFSTMGVVGFEGAEIASDVRKLETVGEAADYVTLCAMAGDDVFYLFCTDELYAQLLSSPEYPDNEHLEYLGNILDANGILHYTYTYSNDTHVISVKVEAYYPGFAIIQAVKNGTTGELEGRIAQTYQAAAELAARAREYSDDPMLVARFIHDELVVRVVYTIDDWTDDDDDAVGALLDGRANCDGYSDAFYLVGTLAGLHVACQSGDAYEGDPETGHMWNVVEMDGAWYVVDITWDDRDDEYGSFSYKWFMIGQDRARRTHIWNDATSIPVAFATDASRRPRVEYTVWSYADCWNVAADIASRGAYAAEVFVEGDDVEGLQQEMLEALHEYGVGNITYSWHDKMRCLFLVALEYW